MASADDKRNQEEDFRHERKQEFKEQKEQKFTDQIPMEDLKVNMKQEKEKKKSQDTSRSERTWTD